MFCGELWRFAAICDELRRFAANFGVLQCFAAFAAFCGVLRQIAAFCCILQQIAAKFLMSMKEYPPSQTPGSFNLDKVQKMIDAAGSGGK